ncbi:MAG: phosphotransferase [Pseudomonadota bacterium]
MSLDTAHRALTQWPLSVADLRLFAQRENAVFRVRTDTGTCFALRVHRQGYQRTAALASELHWMQHLHGAGLPVPVPVPSDDGRLLRHQDGFAVDVLTWLDGEPLGQSGTPLAHADREGCFFRLGQTLARVHAASDAWALPGGFERSAWDLDGLIGDAPLWGPYLDSPALTAAQRGTLARVRDALRAALDGSTLDYGLIHADAVPENVLLTPDGVALIDFDDSGFGYRLFDVATALLKHRAEPDYPRLEAALIAGYRALRPIDTAHLAAFSVMRAQTYIGWIRARIDEPGAAVRQQRVIDTALSLAVDYLERAPA